MALVSNAEQDRVPTSPGAKGRRWDLAIVGATALAALALGFANLARPSLWHDELVHVYVANSILETGRAALPSGHPYASAPLYNAILAGAIALFGDGEAAVRAPCRYVRERLADDVAVIATTYVPVLYYVGCIDDWYPSEHFPQEVWETGSEGIRNVAELEAFVAGHPKGYYLAEWWRLNADVFPQLAADRAWVLEHMTRIDAASSDDVTVYAWGMTPGP